MSTTKMKEKKEKAVKIEGRKQKNDLALVEKLAAWQVKVKAKRNWSASVFYYWIGATLFPGKGKSFSLSLAKDADIEKALDLCEREAFTAFPFPDAPDSVFCTELVEA